VVVVVGEVVEVVEVVVAVVEVVVDLTTFVCVAVEEQEADDVKSVRPTKGS
jgi:hypothetical protein